jgi:peptide deformylase
LRVGLTIVQAGHPVLRQKARALSPREIAGREIQGLIRQMRDAMHAAPGVGLAAPQVGFPFQIAVIEDRREYYKEIPPEQLAERERRPVPFHVIINPVIVSAADNSAAPSTAEFYEGCLSVAGFCALVTRDRAVRVECLDERGKPRVIEASGWYARILQHEIDHLQGVLYIDRMRSRTFTTMDNLTQFWKGKPVEEIRSV